MSTDSARLAQAESYVTTRFYPPLPREYGAIAVLAVDLVNEGDATPIDVTMLIPQPRGSYEMDGLIVADPADIVRALRLEHMIDDDDDDDETVTCDDCQAGRHGACSEDIHDHGNGVTLVCDCHSNDHQGA